jgi:dimethylglycine oxidase
MEDRARVVIVGAGIVGCSVAEHLTRMGWTDVVVLDQGPLDLPGGSTSHAPGLMFQTNPSKTMTSFAKYTVERFSELELDGRSCCHKVGGIEVAATPERWKDLHRKHGIASAWGVESHLISPGECAEKIPILDETKILGGFFTPTDGIAKAVWACEAMMKIASERGARFCGNTEVLGFETENGRMKAVETSRGRIEAEIVLSCAGMWGPKLGKMVGTVVPLTPMQHQYVWTGAVPGLEGETREVVHPILRHQDKAMYMRQNGEKYGVGSYQHRSMTVRSEDIEHPSLSPDMPSIMEFTPEDFEGPWRDAVELLPALEGTTFEKPMNGLFSFTPDGMPMLGESKEVKGFWVAEAVWITHSHGVAKAMAEWLVEGAPDTDVSGCDVNRFDSHAYSPAYTLARSSQSFQEVYDIIHPQQPMEEPRPLRTSPFYVRQRELGAYFLEANGWERPHWFAANMADDEVPGRDEWSGRYWSRAVAAEHKATRERVALYDMTSLKKAEVVGPGALDFLQKLNTNDLDKPPGSVTYTLMLDEKGGIRSDITVARLDGEHFQLGLNGARDMDWMERHLPDDGSVKIRDITSGTCCVGVWGPYARDLVQSLTEDDFSNEAFGFFRAKRAYIGEVPVVALRVSYVGELGWEIYTTADYGLRLWDLLWRAGEPFGVIAGGRGAFNGLRLEKGYRLYGTDMTTEHDPYEAGLAFAVKPDKGDFIGREALLRRKEEGPRRKLACLILEGEQPMMGGEPVFHDGASAGYVTSAEYGHAVQKSIAYAWLQPESAEVGTSVEIQYFGERYEAKVAEEPLFDPKMEKMRGGKKSEQSEAVVENGRPLAKAKADKLEC